MDISSVAPPQVEISYKKHVNKAIAKMIASKLNKQELVLLATLLDADAGHDFNRYIQEEAYKVAPEVFVNPELYEQAHPY